MFTNKTESVLEEKFEGCQCDLKLLTQHQIYWLLVRIINCSRYNESVVAAREEQGADKSAHPSTHTADRSGVMTSATIAVPSHHFEQTKKMGSLILPLHKGVWKTPPQRLARWQQPV